MIHSHLLQPCNSGNKDPNRKLCGKRAIMAPHLSGCQVVPTQERYRWRFDNSCRSLLTCWGGGGRKRPSDTKQRQIKVVRHGESIADTIAARMTSLLDREHDWELRMNLYRKLVSPNIVEINLQSDAVLVSSGRKPGRNKTDCAMGRKL